MSITTFPATLTQSYMISPKVKHFIFTMEHSPPLEYIPGQFITVHFQKDEKELKRSYSIANAPKKNNTLEFAAGFVASGPGTEFLFKLKPGDTINISGPYGRLILKDETPKRYLFVATSTGITPFLAMLHELSIRLTHNPGLKIIILQGVQKREDILYAEEFKTFAANNPRTQFKACLSKEQPEGLHHDETSGYVQHAYPDLNLDPAQDVIYLCGNPSMIDDSFSYLKEKGFSAQNVIREKYLSR